MEKFDEVYIKIRCTSEECDIIRENGIFFETIANALFIENEDVKEVLIIDNKIKIAENYNDKS